MKSTLLAVICGALALSSCAPLVAQQPAVSGDGTSLLVTPGEKYQTITLQLGSRPAIAAKVRLIGQELRVNDKRCRADGNDILCFLGSMSAGEQRMIFATGVKEAHAEVARPSGKTDIYSAV